MIEEIQKDFDLINIFRKLKFIKGEVIIRQVPTLKFITLNNVSINLWRDHFRHVDFSLIRKWNILKNLEIHEKKILERISCLLIPLDCKVSLEQMIYSFKVILGIFLADHHLCKNFTSKKKFNIYMTNICFTQQGTINYAKTASQMIDNAPLSTVDKYKFACNYCLEQKVKALLKLLPEDFIEEDFHNWDHLIMFWTCFLREELDRFSTHVEEAEIFDYILKWAIRNGKEVAVQYIWENFANEDMKNCLIYYMDYSTHYFYKLNYFHDLNNWHYFFQQMSEIQNLNLELDIILRLLENLYTLSKWYNLPPIERYIPALIIQYDVDDAVEILLFCWRKKLISLRQYMSLWVDLLHHFKLDIEKNFINICRKICANLFCQKDVTNFKLFMNFSTRENIKKFLACEGGWKSGIEYCVRLITLEGPVLFNTFLSHVFEEYKEKVLEFKKEILEKKCLELCVGLTVQQKYEWINKFLNDCVSQEQIREIKKKLPLENTAYFMKCISDLVEFDKFDFLEGLNNFLFWCFDGNEEEINRFKALVFDIDTDLYMNERERFFEALHYLVKKRKYDLIEKYMKWIYFASSVDKRTTEEKFVRLQKILELISRKSNSDSSMKFIARHGLLKMFLTSCFQQNEIEELKKELDRRNYILDLVEMLIKDFYYQKCDTLLDWYYSSDAVKINEFKTFFMNSLGCSALYKIIIYRSSFYGTKSLLEWFNPSQESAKSFKDNFLNFLSLKRKLKSQNLEANDEAKRKFERYWTQLNRRAKKGFNFLENLILKKN